MEHGPRRASESTYFNTPESSSRSKMSMLAMSTPSHHAGFRNDYPWDGGRQSEYAYRTRREPERVALPSIRQAFPELHLNVHPEESKRTTSTSTSPSIGADGRATPPEYIHSPSSHNKRRRLSCDDELAAEHGGQVPRLYKSPDGSAQYQPSSSQSRRQSVADAWSGATRTSPLPSRAAPSALSPLTMGSSDRLELRPRLPSLPGLGLEREPVPTPPLHGRLGDEYQRRPSLGPSGPPAYDTPAAYRQQGYPVAYGHPTRVQSLSGGSISRYDRASFGSVVYGGPYHDFVTAGDPAGMNMGLGGDGKQRKRRGNLPKETTDKLRAWFVAHLHHPYPTEDEKQELMRQTGLLMNQISNWFINARRRQLPTMINNARVESDAMAGRGTDGKTAASTEGSDYSDGKRGSMPLSDGEGSPVDDDSHAMSSRQFANMKRGSI